MDPTNVQLAKQIFSDKEMRIRVSCSEHRAGEAQGRGCMAMLSIGGRWGAGEGDHDDHEDAYDDDE